MKNLERFSRCILPALLAMMTGLPCQLAAQINLPVPDHIVIAILENHSYQQIIGSDDAPYINALANDTNSALFSHSYGVEHPSQPNYLDLYSGCNQGVTNNEFPAGSPFTTENLGRQLLDAGKTFVTYSEDLPYVGFNGADSGAYKRKHNPAANWMGTDENQIPETTNQPFSAFPSDSFNLLPTVCYVVPNQLNNMHDGEDPWRIMNGDSWIEEKLGTYAAWAKSNNSLFILTFDEDDYASGNHIPTIFSGSMVKAGVYADTINHYSVLRTLEDMYGLSHACNAATASPIANCWILNQGNAAQSATGNPVFTIFPNPADGSFTIDIRQSMTSKEIRLEILDIYGKTIRSEYITQERSLEIEASDIPAGIYVVCVNDGGRFYTRKLVVR